MKRLALLGSTLLLMTACASCVSPGGGTTVYHHSGAPSVDLQCLALARQGAMGYGGFFSDPILRAAMYDEGTRQLYQQCITEKADQVR